MTTIALQERDARAAASTVRVNVTLASGETKNILFNDLQKELTEFELRENMPLVVQQLADAYCDADEQGNDEGRWTGLVDFDGQRLSGFPCAQLQGWRIH